MTTTDALYRTEPQPYEPGEWDGDPDIKDRCSWRLAVVPEDGGMFKVQQEDLEDGKVWNVVPIRSFITLAEAIAFADKPF